MKIGAKVKQQFNSNITGEKLVQMAIDGDKLYSIRKLITLKTAEVVMGIL